MSSIRDEQPITPSLPKDTTTAESKQKAPKELEFFKKQLPSITKGSENLPEKMDSLIGFAKDKRT